MVLLAHKLSHFWKSHHKLENPKAADSLGEFRSGLSGFLNRIFSSSDPEELWTLGRVQSCLEALCSVHKAFAKTVSTLDHPLPLWGPEIAEEYLDYSFELLGFLNCVSSSLVHLNQARLSLSHGLSQAGSSSLRNIPPLDLQKNLKFPETKQGNEESFKEQERVIHRALQITKRVSFWILGAVLSGLCGDPMPYTELRKSAIEEPLLQSLDSVFCKEIMEKKQSVVKEVKDLNSSAARLAGEDGDSAAEEMGKQLQRFEEKLEGMRNLTDNLFAEVLAARSRLVDSLRCSNN